MFLNTPPNDLLTIRTELSADTCISDKAIPTKDLQETKASQIKRVNILNRVYENFIFVSNQRKNENFKYTINKVTYATSNFCNVHSAQKQTLGQHTSCLQTFD